MKQKSIRRFGLNHFKKQFPGLLIKYFKLFGLTILTTETPLIMFWAYNLGQVRADAVVEPLLVILLCDFILFNMILLILRSLYKTTLMMILISFVFFTYGHVAQMLPANSPLRGVVLFILYMLIFLAGTLLIFAAKIISGNFFLYFAAVAGILLVINSVRILRFDPRITGKALAPSIQAADTIQQEKLPDVYLIILDAYSRDDVLQDVYGYDNAGFLEALRNRGFYIPECAMSNYDSTYDAVASILNLNYLNTMGEPNDTLGVLSSTQASLILNNQARQTFNELGYKFVTTRGYGSFDDIINSDVYLNYYNSLGKEDELGKRLFEYLFLRTTLFVASSDFTPTHPSPSTSTAVEVQQPPDTSSLIFEESDFWWHQTNYVFESLAKLPQTPGNFFVYAHINQPHGPYVYNRDGSFRFAPDLSHESGLYVDAIVDINQKTLNLVDTLIANSDTPPIIIIQADHGTHHYANGINKHKILSAYYLPGTVDIEPYATITPVNDFRLVLHDYFDPSIQLLPDTLFVMENGKYQAEQSACGMH
jgi:hypothetical protein